MLCKSCNTRLDGTERHCPNCGRALRDPGSTGSQPAPPTLPPRPAPSKAELEVELDQEVAARPAKPAGGGKGVARAAGKAPGKAPAAIFSLDPSELRARIAEHPEQLEAGLAVYSDEKGKAIGAGYATDVGEIDLLGRGRDGSLVVVMVAERGAPGDPLAAALDRVGWVAKHLAEGAQGVRAIVLLEPPGRKLGYAARAVADTVSFKTYRVALTFDDLEI